MARNTKPVLAPVPETVDNVSHYDGTACLDAIRTALGREQFIGWLRGTIMAYQWRLGKKGDSLEDAQKSKWYNDVLVVELESE